MKKPNMPDAENTAIAPQLTIGYHGRGVSNPFCSARDNRKTS